MKKSVLSAIVFLLTSVCASYAQTYTSPWESADKETKSVLVRVDSMISQGQYKSAYDELEKVGEKNSFILAKQAEICINFYAQSISHRFFGLTDLKKGQTLDDVRKFGGNFSLVAFDPEENFKDRIPGKDSGILYLEQGNYYFDVLQRYSGSWKIADSEIVNRIIDSYENAFRQNIITESSLNNYANTQLQQKQFSKAAEKLIQLTSMSPKNGDYQYNLAYAFLLTGKYESALERAKLAASLYKNNSYVFDSYLLASDADSNLNRVDDALMYLQKADQLIPGDYRIPMKKNKLLVEANRISEAADAGIQLFSMAPDNPAAGQMLLRNYEASSHGVQLLDLFQVLAGKYSANSAVLANIYFCKSQAEYHLGRKKDAISSIEIAREYFKKIESSGDGIFTTIDSQVKIYEQ